MMIESWANDFVACYLGQFIDIQPEKLRVSLWSAWKTGVTLDHVNLRPEAFQHLQLPFSFVSGSIGCLQAQIPWRALSSPIVVELSDVHIKFKPLDESEIDDPKLASQHAWRAKQAAIAIAEIAASQMNPNNANNGINCNNTSMSSGGGVLWYFLHHVLTTLINRLQLSLKNITVSFEDPSTGREFGFQLAELKTCLAEETGSSSVEDNNNTASAVRGSIQKQFKMEGLALHWHPAQQQHITDNRSSDNGSDKHFILRPADMTVHMTSAAAASSSSGGGVSSVNSAVHIHVATRVHSLEMSVTPEQIKDMLLFSDGLQWLAAKSRRAAFRPNNSSRVEDSDDEHLQQQKKVLLRERWKFAINAVYSDLHGNDAASLRKWKDTESGRRARSRYVLLYRKKIADDMQLSATGEEQLKVLELELPLEDVVSCRATARKIVFKSGDISSEIDRQVQLQQQEAKKKQEYSTAAAIAAASFSSSSSVEQQEKGLLARGLAQAASTLRYYTQRGTAGELSIAAPTQEDVEELLQAVDFNLQQQQEGMMIDGEDINSSNNNAPPTLAPSASGSSSSGGGGGMQMTVDIMLSSLNVELYNNIDNIDTTIKAPSSSITTDTATVAMVSLDTLKVEVVKDSSSEVSATVTLLDARLDVIGQYETTHMLSRLDSSISTTSSRQQSQLVVVKYSQPASTSSSSSSTPGGGSKIDVLVKPLHVELPNPAAMSRLVAFLPPTLPDSYGVTVMAATNGLNKQARTAIKTKMIQDLGPVVDLLVKLEDVHITLVTRNNSSSGGNGAKDLGDSSKRQLYQQQYQGPDHGGLIATETIVVRTGAILLHTDQSIERFKQAQALCDFLEEIKVKTPDIAVVEEHIVYNNMQLSISSLNMLFVCCSQSEDGVEQEEDVVQILQHIGLKANLKLHRIAEDFGVPQICCALQVDPIVLTITAESMHMLSGAFSEEEEKEEGEKDTVAGAVSLSPSTSPPVKPLPSGPLAQLELAFLGIQLSYIDQIKLKTDAAEVKIHLDVDGALKLETSLQNTVLEDLFSGSLPPPQQQQQHSYGFNTAAAAAAALTALPPPVFSPTLQLNTNALSTATNSNSRRRKKRKSLHSDEQADTPNNNNNGASYSPIPHIAHTVAIGAIFIAVSSSSSAAAAIHTISTKADIVGIEVQGYADEPGNFITKLNEAEPATLFINKYVRRTELSSASTTMTQVALSNVAVGHAILLRIVALVEGPPSPSNAPSGDGDRIHTNEEKEGSSIPPPTDVTNVSTTSVELKQCRVIWKHQPAIVETSMMSGMLRDFLSVHDDILTLDIPELSLDLPFQVAGTTSSSSSSSSSSSLKQLIMARGVTATMATMGLPGVSELPVMNIPSIQLDRSFTGSSITTKSIVMYEMNVGMIDVSCHPSHVRMLAALAQSYNQERDLLKTGRRSAKGSASVVNSGVVFDNDDEGGTSNGTLSSSSLASHHMHDDDSGGGITIWGDDNHKTTSATATDRHTRCSQDTSHSNVQTTNTTTIEKSIPWQVKMSIEGIGLSVLGASPSSTALKIELAYLAGKTGSSLAPAAAAAAAAANPSSEDGKFYCASVQSMACYVLLPKQYKPRDNHLNNNNNNNNNKEGAMVFDSHPNSQFFAPPPVSREHSYCNLYQPQHVGGGGSNNNSGGNTPRYMSASSSFIHQPGLSSIGQLGHSHTTTGGRDGGGEGSGSYQDALPYQLLMRGNSSSSGFKRSTGGPSAVSKYFSVAESDLDDGFSIDGRGGAGPGFDGDLHPLSGRGGGHSPPSFVPLTVWNSQRHDSSMLVYAGFTDTSTDGGVECSNSQDGHMRTIAIAPLLLRLYLHGWHEAFECLGLYAVIAHESKMGFSSSYVDTYTNERMAREEGRLEAAVAGNGTGDDASSISNPPLSSGTTIYPTDKAANQDNISSLASDTSLSLKLTELKVQVVATWGRLNTNNRGDDGGSHGGSPLQNSSGTSPVDQQQAILQRRQTDNDQNNNCNDNEDGDNEKDGALASSSRDLVPACCFSTGVDVEILGSTGRSSTLSSSTSTTTTTTSVSRICLPGMLLKVGAVSLESLWEDQLFEAFRYQDGGDDDSTTVGSSSMVGLLVGGSSKRSRKGRGGSSLVGFTPLLHLDTSLLGLNDVQLTLLSDGHTAATEVRVFVNKVSVWADILTICSTVALADEVGKVVDAAKMHLSVVHGGGMDNDGAGGGRNTNTNTSATTATGATNTTYNNNNNKITPQQQQQQLVSIHINTAAVMLSIMDGESSSVLGSNKLPLVELAIKHIAIRIEHDYVAMLLNTIISMKTQVSVFSPGNRGWEPLLESWQCRIHCSAPLVSWSASASGSAYSGIAGTSSSSGVQQQTLKCGISSDAGLELTVTSAAVNALSAISLLAPVLSEMVECKDLEACLHAAGIKEAVHAIAARYFVRNTTGSPLEIWVNSNGSGDGGDTWQELHDDGRQQPHTVVPGGTVVVPVIPSDELAFNSQGQYTGVPSQMYGTTLLLKETNTTTSRATSSTARMMLRTKKRSALLYFKLPGSSCVMGPIPLDQTDCHSTVLSLNNDDTNPTPTIATGPRIVCDVVMQNHGGALVKLHSGVKVWNNSGLVLEVGMQAPLGLVMMEPAVLGTLEPGESMWLPALRGEGGLLCVKPKVGGGGMDGDDGDDGQQQQARRSSIAAPSPMERPPTPPGVLYSGGQLSPAARRHRYHNGTVTDHHHLNGRRSGDDGAPVLYDWSAPVALQNLFSAATANQERKVASAGRQLSCPAYGNTDHVLLLSIGASALTTTSSSSHEQLWCIDIDAPVTLTNTLPVPFTMKLTSRGGNNSSSGNLMAIPNRQSLAEQPIYVLPHQQVKLHSLEMGRIDHLEFDIIGYQGTGPLRVSSVVDKMSRGEVHYSDSADDDEDSTAEGDDISGTDGGEESTGSTAHHHSHYYWWADDIPLKLTPSAAAAGHLTAPSTEIAVRHKVGATTGAHTVHLVCPLWVYNFTGLPIALRESLIENDEDDEDEFGVAIGGRRSSHRNHNYANKTKNSDGGITKGIENSVQPLTEDHVPDAWIPNLNLALPSYGSHLVRSSVREPGSSSTCSVAAAAAGGCAPASLPISPLVPAHLGSRDYNNNNNNNDQSRVNALDVSRVASAIDMPGLGELLSTTIDEGDDGDDITGSGHQQQARAATPATAAGLSTPLRQGTPAAATRGGGLLTTTTSPITHHHHRSSLGRASSTGGGGLGLRGRGASEGMTEVAPALETSSVWPTMQGGLVGLQSGRRGGGGLSIQVRAAFSKAPLGKSYWSDSIDLESSLGGAAEVMVPAPLLSSASPSMQTLARAGYVFSVMSSTVPGSGGARALYLLPRYLLYNTLNVPIQYKQQGTTLERELAPGAARAIRWADTSLPLRLCVRVQGAGWSWSGGAALDVLGDAFVKIRHRDRGVTMLMGLDVSTSSSGVLKVTLSHQPAGFAPYRIENCSLETLHARQNGVTEQQDILRPFCALNYAWDEPTMAHNLVLELPGSRQIGTFDLDKVGQDKVFRLRGGVRRQDKSETKVRVIVRAEGPTRVLTLMDTSLHIDDDVLHQNSSALITGLATYNNKFPAAATTALSAPTTPSKDGGASDANAPPPTTNSMTPLQPLNKHAAVGQLWELSINMASVGLSIIANGSEVLYLRAGAMYASASASSACYAVAVNLKTLQVDNPSIYDFSASSFHGGGGALSNRHRHHSSSSGGGEGGGGDGGASSSSSSPAAAASFFPVILLMPAPASGLLGGSAVSVVEKHRKPALNASLVVWKRRPAGVFCVEHADLQLGSIGVYIEQKHVTELIGVLSQLVVPLKGKTKKQNNNNKMLVNGDNNTMMKRSRSSSSQALVSTEDGAVVVASSMRVGAGGGGGRVSRASSGASLWNDNSAAIMGGGGTSNGQYQMTMMAALPDDVTMLLAAAASETAPTVHAGLALGTTPPLPPTAASASTYHFYPTSTNTAVAARSSLLHHRQQQHHHQQQQYYYYQQQQQQCQHEMKVYMDYFAIGNVDLVISFHPAPYEDSRRAAALLASAGIARGWGSRAAAALQRLVSVMADIEDAPIHLPNMEMNNPLMGTSALVQKVKAHYTSPAVYLQLIRMVGSASVLGDPTTLVTHLSQGLYAFVANPAAGLMETVRRKRGPGEVVMGLVAGTEALFRNVVFALSNAAAKGAGAARKAIVVLGLEERRDLNQVSLTRRLGGDGTGDGRRRRWRLETTRDGKQMIVILPMYRKRGLIGSYTHADGGGGGGEDDDRMVSLFSKSGGGDGREGNNDAVSTTSNTNNTALPTISSHTNNNSSMGDYSLVEALFAGMVGLIAEPIRGLNEQGGLAGLASGIRRGALGLVILPLASLLGSMAELAESVRRAVAGTNSIGWARPPRYVPTTSASSLQYLGGGGGRRSLPLPCYNASEAMGRWLLLQLQAAAASLYDREEYVLCMPSKTKNGDTQHTSSSSSSSSMWVLVTGKKVLYVEATKPMWRPVVKWWSWIMDLERISNNSGQVRLVGLRYIKEELFATEGGSGIYYYNGGGSRDHDEDTEEDGGSSSSGSRGHLHRGGPWSCLTVECEGGSGDGEMLTEMVRGLMEEGQKRVRYVGSCQMIMMN